MLTLQHYTTIETIRKIIENSSIHLTDFRFTNDIKELIYGFKSLYPLFQYAVKENNITAHITDEELIKAEFEQQVNTIKEALVQSGSLYIYCLCNVTNMPDAVKNYGILSMWRAYSNNSHGAIIEFQAEEFVKDVINEPVSDLLVRFDGDVTYGDDLEEFCNKLDNIKLHNTNLDKNKKELIKDLFKTLINTALKQQDLEKRNLSGIAALVATSCFFKHDGFKEENEYRVAITKASRLFKDSNNFGTVPYIETKINLDKISRIIIGPALYQSNQDIISVINDFLHLKIGKNNINVVVSGIPYRV